MVTDSARVGIILAGGRSQRMGFNKANVRLGGQTLIERAIERLSSQLDTLLISTNEKLPLPANYPQLADSVNDYAGPLAGVLSGLLWLQQQQPDAHWLLSVSVDTPFFPQDLYQRLKQEARPPLKIVSASSNQRLHPTCSLWHCSLVAPLQEFLIEQQQRRMMSFLASQPSTNVEFDFRNTDPFSNINSLADLTQAATKL